MSTQKQWGGIELRKRKNIYIDRIPASGCNSDRESDWQVVNINFFFTVGQMNRWLSITDTIIDQTLPTLLMM